MKEKKKILLTAGGTATTWHFCKIINEYYVNDFDIYITDTNDEYLVPSAIYAKKFFKVPSVYEDNYIDTMYEILEKEKIDIIVPLIDFDLFKFSKDNIKLIELGVYTTAPLLKTIETLTNKEKMYRFMKKYNIPTPNVYSLDEVEDDKEYIIKPKTGFGSIGVYKKLGCEIKNIKNFDEIIIQELCKPEEITVEVFNDDILKIFQRKRVATKSGVCVKMEPVYIEQIDNSIKLLVENIECPNAFCIQFMQNEKGLWCITDCNLRIGAGTALSTKIGFQLVRACLAHMINREVSDDFFTIDKEVKSVLRVYEEIVIK